MKRFPDLGIVELRVFTPDCLYCLSEAGSESICKEWVGFTGLGEQSLQWLLCGGLEWILNQEATEFLSLFSSKLRLEILNSRWC